MLIDTIVEAAIRINSKNKLDRLNHLFADTETKISIEFQELSRQIDIQLKKATDEQKTELEIYYNDEDYRLNEVFPNIFRSSILVSCYSILESEMKGICTFHKRKNNLIIDVNDLRGMGINPSKVYLEKVCQTNFPTGNNWEKISELNKVRNCIVHAAGRIDNDNKPRRIRNIISQNPSLSENRIGEIMIGSNYVTDSINIVGDFLNELYDMIFEKK